MTHSVSARTRGQGSNVFRPIIIKKKKSLWNWWFHVTDLPLWDKNWFHIPIYLNLFWHIPHPYRFEIFTRHYQKAHSQKLKQNYFITKIKPNLLTVTYRKLSFLNLTIITIINKHNNSTIIIETTQRRVTAGFFPTICLTTYW